MATRGSPREIEKGKVVPLLVEALTLLKSHTTALEVILPPGAAAEDPLRDRSPRPEDKC